MNKNNNTNNKFVILMLFPYKLTDKVKMYNNKISLHRDYDNVLHIVTEIQ